ncbi:MAG: hypothetical protein K0S71_2317 [Clostridia bacterium]|jgi:predicted RNase H-like nuclease (RuvC/YqgF family)|nr:hypothetical protein [Clostridia bacterium]
MNNSKKKLLGYSVKQVKEYFNELEKKHHMSLLQKELELSEINKKINELAIENKNLTEELDALNRKKNDFINHVNSRIDKIERFVNNKQAESTAIKQSAIEDLMLKRAELAKAQDRIKELKKDLSYIKNRRKLTDELLDL